LLQVEEKTVSLIDPETKVGEQECRLKNQLWYTGQGYHGTYWLDQGYHIRELLKVILASGSLKAHLCLTWKCDWRWCMEDDAVVWSLRRAEAKWRSVTPMTVPTCCNVDSRWGVLYKHNSSIPPWPCPRVVMLTLGGGVLYKHNSSTMLRVTAGPV
jgi:hypothetical protein